MENRPVVLRYHVSLRFLVKLVVVEERALDRTAWAQRSIRVDTLSISAQERGRLLRLLQQEKHGRTSHVMGSMLWRLADGRRLVHCTKQRAAQSLVHLIVKVDVLLGGTAARATRLIPETR
jgi:hypothetical protein